MTIDIAHLRSIEFPVRTYRYDERDLMLYALAVGFGRTLPEELPFVFEPILRPLPTAAAVLAWDDTWQERLGLDVPRVLHGAMRVSMHRPLAPRGEVRARLSIVDVLDKGRERGSLWLAQTDLADAATDAPVATLLSTVFARGDGGCGSTTAAAPAPHRLPERPADLVATLGIRPEQAALYRLCGDRNPLHVDPEFARAAGFERPILHGLCTWGAVAGQLVRTVCSGDPARLTAFEARFTAPVLPGETLVTEIWSDGSVVSFRTRVAERGTVVLDHGKAVVGASA